MAATLETRPQLTPAVRTVLGALRGRIRWYVWVEGLTMAAAWLGAAFWLSLGIDWFFEPPAAVRGVLLGAIGLGLLSVLFYLIGRRAFVRLSDSNMATLLERRFPQLDDGLLTAVLLTGHETDPEECNPVMLARTCREASNRIGGIRLGEVFNPAPLMRSSIAAVLLLASVAAFVAFLPAASGVWARRALLFRDELWPRKSCLTVEGFVCPEPDRCDNGVVKVARGADFELIAKADTSYEIIPKTVQIRYRTRGRKNKTMSREGTADPAKDPFQVYSYAIRGILTPIRFDLIGGDARIRNLQIEVVDSPTVAEMWLDCEYPPYTERLPRTLPVSGVMQVPQGTKVTIRARANKEITGVQIDTVTEEDLQPAKVLEWKSPVRDFRHTIPSLDRDTTLLFTLSDTDGITAREPVRLSLVTVVDAAPEVSARLDGIGQAITPVATIPVVGRITDDWAVADVWFETMINDEKPARHPVAYPRVTASTGKPPDLPPDTALEVDRLGLVPGQKLLVSVKASDYYNLGEDKRPNVGASERWLLDVVTAEQLRAMLEARELVLRQRLEAILEEVTETRDLLLRLDFGDKKVDNNKEGGVGGEPGDEPGDEPEAVSPMQQLSRRTLRVQRALTNARKTTHETQGVADAFDNIRKQLINNRIDTEELKIRLAEGIVAPLNRIAGEMFPELERRLVGLQKILDDKQLGPQQAELARQQADEILLAMRKVLDRIIELEDFNEAVELLRTIIKLQGQLDEQTKQRHKQKLRELLED